MKNILENDYLTIRTYYSRNFFIMMLIILVTVSIVVSAFFIEEFEIKYKGVLNSAVFIVPFVITGIYWISKNRKMVIDSTDIKIFKFKRNQPDELEIIIFKSNIQKISLEDKPGEKTKHISSLLTFYLTDNTKKKYLVDDNFTKKLDKKLKEFNYSDIIVKKRNAKI